MQAFDPIFSYPRIRNITRWVTVRQYVIQLRTLPFVDKPYGTVPRQESRVVGEAWMLMLILILMLMLMLMRDERMLRMPRVLVKIKHSKKRRQPEY